jgi:hypothetical protein
MLEILVCSLFVGSLGVQAVVAGSWMYWQQSVEGNQDEEEEILTQYESKQNAPVQQANVSNLQQPRDPRLAGWEFKIVRANRNVFRDPVVLQHLCKEEAEAGWILLEKLDDHRVRFKRPMALRYTDTPEFLVNDPYRCYYGSSWQPITWLSAIAVLATLLPAYLGYALVSQSLARSGPTQIQPSVFPPLEQSPSP